MWLGLRWHDLQWHRLQPVRCKGVEGLARGSGQRQGRSLQRLKPVQAEPVTAGLKPGPPKPGLLKPSPAKPGAPTRPANSRAVATSHTGSSAGERGGIFFRLLFFLFFIVFCALVYVARHPLMRFAGEFWVVDEPAAPSDALIVLGDDNYPGDRAFLAAGLYRAGLVPVVVASGRMLRQNASAAALIEHDLESFGVPAASIVKLSHRADNTKDEAVEVAKLVDTRHWKRILVVTSNYHARRARFIYGRVLPSSVTFRVSGARDSEFDPARWWETRRGRKLFFTELVAYAVARWELRGRSPQTQTSSRA
jgi:uncharacterized SAM-binding protein YcdF (DUF218 family)